MLAEQLGEIDISTTFYDCGGCFQRHRGGGHRMIPILFFYQHSVQYSLLRQLNIYRTDFRMLRY